MMYRITATPHHKQVPYTNLASFNEVPDGDLSGTVGRTVMDAVSNVRKRGSDMRDDWTIVVQFRTAR